jgi:DNA repair protein RecO (recombination protein O)
MSVVTVPAILLRTHPYSESSLILRFLTPDFGVTSVLARGIRSGASKGRAALEIFQRGALTFAYAEGKDLHGFREFEASGSPRGLGSDLLRLSGASFLAEILLAHAEEAANEGLFFDFVEGVERIADGPATEVPGWILAQAWVMLSDFGFPPSLEACLQCGGELPGNGFARFDRLAGGVRCASCASAGGGPRLGPKALSDLRALVAGVPPTELEGAEAHLAFVERYALHHLGMRHPFRSTPLLRAQLRPGAAGDPKPGGAEYNAQEG